LRFYELAANFLAMVQLASMRLWLRGVPRVNDRRVLEPTCLPSGCNRLRTILDFTRLLCYLPLMNRAVRNANRKHMTRFGWAVEGVAR
jgi:hypothetical protein